MSVGETAVLAEATAQAVRGGAGLFQAGDLGVFSIRGEDRVRWLDGMVSGDVGALEAQGPGAGCYALLLTNRGKIVADLHIGHAGDAFRVACQAAAVPVVLETLERFIIADDVTLEDETEKTACFGLEGPQAAAILAAASGQPAAAFAELSRERWAEAEIAGTAVRLGAFGWTGEEGFQIFVPVAENEAGTETAANAVGEALASAGRERGLVRGDAALLLELRIEAGIPALGAELDDNVLPPEARLEAAIATNKGCYVGQEIVARLRARGQVNHLLVGIAWSADSPGAAPASSLVGAELMARGPTDRKNHERGGFGRSGRSRARLRPTRALGTGHDARSDVRRRSPAERRRGSARRRPGGGAALRARGAGAFRDANPCRSIRTRGRTGRKRNGPLLIRGQLIVFAKAPRAGLVKTRMSPPFSLEDCAAFYREMLLDVLGASLRFAAALDLEPVVAFHPADAAREMAALAPPGFRLQLQRGEGLGERMTHAVREASAAGASRVLLRGSDSPALGGAVLEGLLRELDGGADVALSPDQGGGYAAIGVCAPEPRLFDLPMSTQSVCEQTLERAASLGLRAVASKASFDLDSVGDLQLLSGLSPQESSDLCPRTVQFLSTTPGWPVL